MFEILDLVIFLSSYFSDEDKDNFFNVNKLLRKYKSFALNVYGYTTIISYSKLMTLPKEQRLWYTRVKLDVHKLNDDCELHDNLVYIRMEPYFDKDHILKLPCKLKTLILGTWFNRPLSVASKLSPLSLTTNDDDKPVILPEELEELELGVLFNKCLCLPPCLKKLTFGVAFNQPLNLPNSLTYLNLSPNFNLPLELPPKLEVLILGFEFNQRLNFPDSLKYLAYNRGVYNNPVNVPILCTVQKCMFGDKVIIPGSCSKPFRYGHFL
jgi:hypothetical protein